MAKFIQCQTSIGFQLRLKATTTLSSHNMAQRYRNIKDGLFGATREISLFLKNPNEAKINVKAKCSEGRTDKSTEIMVRDQEAKNLQEDSNFVYRLRNWVSKIMKILRESVRKEVEFISKNPRKVSLGFLAFFAMMTWMTMKLKSPRMFSPEKLPFSEFIQLVKSERVAEAGLVSNSNQILFKMKGFNLDEFALSRIQKSMTTLSLEKAAKVEKFISDPAAFEKVKKLVPVWPYVCERIPRDESFLLEMLAASGVKFGAYSVPLQNTVAKTARDLLLLLPSVAILAFYFRSMMNNYRKGNWKKQFGVTTSFSDVAGVETAKEELMEVVRYLKGDPVYSTVGAKLPKGILLIGPPGTGKTLLARAVAGEAGVPFFSTSASEFVEIFSGRGAARVRELFSQARRCEPSIIFIDELDGLGGSRNTSLNEERDQTLNQLLTELDGFDKSDKVLVLAATNRAEILDPALVRPGRLSRKVEVGLPDLQGRIEILEVHMRGKPLEGREEVIRAVVASQTNKFSGAGLANVVNEAAFLASRRGVQKIGLEDFLEAVKRAKRDQDLVQLRNWGNPFKSILLQ